MTGSAAAILAIAGLGLTKLTEVPPLRQRSASRASVDTARQERNSSLVVSTTKPQDEASAHSTARLMSCCHTFRVNASAMPRVDITTAGPCRRRLLDNRVRGSATMPVAGGRSELDGQWSDGESMTLPIRFERPAEHS
jgi:hypothetical protein